MTQIFKLADFWTGSENSADVKAKSIAAVRSIETFLLVSQNPPKQPQALTSALRACKLEADQAALISHSSAETFISSEKVVHSFLSTAGNWFEAFLVEKTKKR